MNYTDKQYYIFHQNKAVHTHKSAFPVALSYQILQRLCPDENSLIIPEVPVAKKIYAATFPDSYPLIQEYESTNLRRLIGRVDDTLFSQLSRASQLLHWYVSNRFCGHCGKTTDKHPNELAKYCSTCNVSFYPVISPCIIVLIHRPGEILLGRSPRFPHGMFSTLAGFIEPGESAEEALHREVWEEVRIQVKNLHYFKSQPWPFPGQLMLGYYADYHSGEITIDGNELCEANWYPLDDLPVIPDKATISGQLIRNHLEKNGIMTK